MNRQQDDFRDRLLGAQQFTPEYRERYQRRLDSMLTRQLTPARRVVYGILALTALIGGISFGIQSIAGDMTGEYAVWGRTVLGLFAVWALAYATYLGYITIRGKMDLRKDRSVIAGMRWAFLLGTGIVLLLASMLQLRYEPGSNWFIFNALIGLVFLAWSALVLIKNLLQQSELNVQERLLTIELRLVEMNEKLEKVVG